MKFFHSLEGEVLQHCGVRCRICNSSCLDFSLQSSILNSENTTYYELDDQVLPFETVLIYLCPACGWKYIGSEV